MPTGMSDRPTLRTIAAEAGVSIATVSYVLSGHARDREGAPGKVFDLPWQLIVRESTEGAR